MPSIEVLTAAGLPGDRPHDGLVGCKLIISRDEERTRSNDRRLLIEDREAASRRPVEIAHSCRIPDDEVRRAD